MIELLQSRSAAGRRPCGIGDRAADIALRTLELEMLLTSQLKDTGQRKMRLRPQAVAQAVPVLEAIGFPRGCAAWANALGPEGVAGAILAYVRSCNESSLQGYVDLLTGLAICCECGVWSEPIRLGLFLFSRANSAVENELRALWEALSSQGREHLPYRDWRVSMAGQLAANVFLGRITSAQYAALYRSILEQELESRQRSKGCGRGSDRESFPVLMRNEGNADASIAAKFLQKVEGNALVVAGFLKAAHDSVCRAPNLPGGSGLSISIHRAHKVFYEIARNCIDRRHSPGERSPQTVS